MESFVSLSLKEYNDLRDTKLNLEKVNVELVVNQHETELKRVELSDALLREVGKYWFELDTKGEITAKSWYEDDMAKFVKKWDIKPIQVQAFMQEKLVELTEQKARDDEYARERAERVAKEKKEKEEKALKEAANG